MKMASTAPGKRSFRDRVPLAVALTAVAGAVDALSFTSLGRVFTANMTGNIVLLGIAAGTGLGAETWRAAAAFAGFAAGLYTGYQFARPGAPIARLLRVSVALAFGFEFLLVTVFAALWLGTAAHPAGGQLLGLICLLAVTMGIQSATATRLAVSGVSTTFVTGTLTTLVGSVALAGRPSAHAISQAAALMALGAGAALAIIVGRIDPLFAPLVPLAILAVAVVIATRSADLR